MKREEQTFYEILRILPTATLAEIKRAYRQRCMEYHPDVNPGANNRSCHEMMCKINEAYSVLRDNESRKAYDESLKLRGQYYPSEATTPEGQSEQPTTQSEGSSKTYKKQDYSEDIYDYYNSDDFDEDIEEEFINWMEGFFEKYLAYVYQYYQKYRISKNDESLLERLYNLIENNIIAEKSNIKKKANMR